ncbi:phytoene/squalene synthetase [Paenibacillus mucilaginosus 3016]|uniref:Phytoene/squalene synthetase n=2 Tax=Paenibacillus mucilaginosus TaxID=61624 RepID=H6ND69_9BACL|nr:phytoene/squalene synthase family protein [Paenibacillus mucilaginosus]AFC30030.1 phytoene/squalene synthetase [Paenibacillus mucilaginosus 3016]AFH62216.1 phytoene synthase [Paenibacillus mucilaginosus K02]WFA18686.1 phytoene/squalene synthase family protein [Paenibacillus mucilaginosus]
MNLNQSAAYAVCEGVVRRHSSSFYRAFSLLPAHKRNAVWAVYAFCRTADDLVDLRPDTACEELATFEEAFRRMLAGAADDHPHWIALADVFASFPMDPEPFFGMIAGQRQDLTKVRYDSMEELEHYCYLVAGTVGEMLLPILAPSVTDEMRRTAVQLGAAMQLTNILRDVREDYERGRVYLPRTLMQRFGYSVSDMSQGVHAPGWRPLFRHLADLAETKYREGLSAMAYYPRDGRLALGAAGSIYRQILMECRDRHGDVFSGRVVVSNMKKASIMLSLLVQASTWRRRRAAVAGERRLTW